MPTIHVTDIPLEAFRRYHTCPCGGILEFSGRIKPVNPAIYIHGCPLCRTEYELDDQTGSIIYKAKPIG